MSRALLEKPVVPRSVVGIDLSLSRPAAVHLPANWSPSDPWEGIAWTAIDVEECFAEKLRAAKKMGHDAFVAARLALIVQQLVRFIRVADPPRGPSHVAVEDHAYHAGRGGTMAGAELHGALKSLLYLQEGIVLRPVNIMTARKTFLGARMPRKDARVLAHEEIGKLRPPWTLPNGDVPSDEGDALLIASHFRSTLGLPAMVVG